MSKTCFKCQRTLPYSEFYHHPMMGDRHLGKCKDCTKRDVQTRRKQCLEYYREYDRKRTPLPHRRALRARIVAAERANFPERNRARQIVTRAVRTGRLIRPTHCEECGQAHEWIHAHHEDYSRPLEVRWVCPSCHVYANRKAS